MTKKELKEIITLYKNTENIITELDDKYGICVGDSKQPNFYNNYNLIIHKFGIILFGQKNTDLIEDYIFDQVNISFDELCDRLNIKQ